MAFIIILVLVIVASIGSLMRLCYLSGENAGRQMEIDLTMEYVENNPEGTFFDAVNSKISSDLFTENRYN